MNVISAVTAVTKFAIRDTKLSCSSSAIINSTQCKNIGTTKVMLWKKN